MLTMMPSLEARHALAREIMNIQERISLVTSTVRTVWPSEQGVELLTSLQSAGIHLNRARQQSDELIKEPG